MPTRMLGGLLAATMAVVALSGCAAIRRDEALKMDRLLAAAGFHIRPANTPQRLAQLKSLTPLTLMPRQVDGRTFYVVADPDACKCLYVGDAQAYDEYQRLSLRKQFADDRLAAAEMNEDAAMDWGAWGPWGVW